MMFANAPDALDRHAELGKPGGGKVLRVGQVRHGDQVQLAVEDAEDLVALEVQLLDVGLNLAVVGRIAEAQVTVLLAEAEQVRAFLSPAAAA